LKTVVTKGEFAQRHSRSPAWVSNMIAEGKITPEALIGDGVRARIWVERADADLAGSLDPSQQAAQARPIQVSIPFERESAAASEGAISPETSALRELERQRHADLARRAKADADSAEHEAEAKRRRNALDEGKYVLAEEASRTFARQLAETTAKTDTFIVNRMARDTAEKFNLDWKEVSAFFREQWRAFRASVAAEARTARERRSEEEPQS
jgi:hypothetical protein